MSTYTPSLEIIEFSDGETFASIDLTKTGDGWSSRWWVSRRDPLGIQVIAYLELPVFGSTIMDAERRVGFIASEVTSFARTVSGGLGTIQYQPETDDEAQAYATAHASSHVLAHGPHLTSPLKTVKTAILYEMLSHFHVRAPAVLLADYEGLSSVRTIHERLAEARKQGILPSPGQGRQS